MKTRCAWVAGGDLLYEDYHDKEWGVPIHDDTQLFGFLILEGAQAGLSWKTILSRRDHYRQAFAGFDPDRVAKFALKEIETLLANAGIIRNRLKIQSAIGNAQRFLQVQKEFGSFDAYQWQFVGGKVVKNHHQTDSEVPATSPQSIAFSRDLVKRGFTFVGPTIIYAYMQATGMVNDHTAACFRYDQV